MGKRTIQEVQPRIIQAKDGEFDSSSKKPRIDTVDVSLANTLLSIQSDSQQLPTAARNAQEGSTGGMHVYVSDDDESGILTPTTWSTLNGGSNKLVRFSLPCPPRLVTFSAHPATHQEEAKATKFSLPPGRPLPPRPTLPTRLIGCADAQKGSL